MRSIKAFVVLIALTAVSSALPAEVPGALQKDVPLMKTADQRAQQVDKAIWQNFTFQDVPVFIFDSATNDGLLFHVSPLPAGFNPLGADSPGVGVGSIAGGQKPVEGVGPIAERLGAWISTQSLPVASEPRSIEIIYRRAFRVFEAYRGFPQPAMPEGVYFSDLDAQNDALSRAEDMLLVHMLSAQRSALPSLIGAFLSLRNSRQSGIPAALRPYEWAAETTNGLAEYAGYMARSGSDPDGARQDLIHSLETFGKEGRGVTGERFTYTGCALALVLDTVGVDWKTEFEQTDKSSLEPVLVKVAGSAPIANLSFLDLDGIVKEESVRVAAIKARQQAEMDEITKAPGLVVELDLSSALTVPGIDWSNKYVPTGVTDISRTTQIRDNYYSLTGAGMLQFASSRPVLIKIRESITSGFAKDEIPYITLDGRKLELRAGQAVTGELEIKGVHYSLKVKKARLEYQPGLLKVSPMAPGTPVAAGGQDGAS